MLRHLLKAPLELVLAVLLIVTVLLGLRLFTDGTITVGGVFFAVVTTLGVACGIPLFRRRKA